MQPDREPSPAELGLETLFRANRSDRARPLAQPKSLRSTSRRTAIAEGLNWLYEPRTAVLIVLGSVALIGGGRRLLEAWKSRLAVARLGEPDVTPEEVASAVRFGRAGLMELFRIFSESSAPALRAAAGCALCNLWAKDQLVGEEEKALVRRGYLVDWKARQRYPRALTREIPIAVDYGLPFLREAGLGITAASLEWSHRLLGARRASIEEPSPWTLGPGRLTFSIVPSDFQTEGPHRLVLQTRVRTRGLSDTWEIELPHMPFHFELDPQLETGSLLASPDENRSAVFASAVRLECRDDASRERSRFLPLGNAFALRHPPRLVADTPLPCDLAHRVLLEFEDVKERFPAGAVVLSGQGARQESSDAPAASFVRPQVLSLGPIEPLGPETIDRPGPRRLRVILEPDCDLGWTDPDVRSIWPGTIETGWTDVEVVRI
jgi:hypothetical protein